MAQEKSNRQGHGVKKNPHKGFNDTHQVLGDSSSFGLSSKQGLLDQIGSLAPCFRYELIDRRFSAPSKKIAFGRMPSEEILVFAAAAEFGIKRVMCGLSLELKTDSSLIGQT